MIDSVASSPATVAQTAAPVDEKLMRAAMQLEASFLSEMLKAAKFGEARDSFGGGIGEDQFASFLRDAHAQNVVETGGIGLAESIYQALQNQ